MPLFYIYRISCKNNWSFSNSFGCGLAHFFFIYWISTVPDALAKARPITLLFFSGSPKTDILSTLGRRKRFSIKCGTDIVVTCLISAEYHLLIIMFLFILDRVGNGENPVSFFPICALLERFLFTLCSVDATGSNTKSVKNLRFD